MTSKSKLPTPPRDDAELAEVLRERGLRATSQRVVMHRLLRDRARHVSAEELLSEASDRLPGVSLPTVYATLELFERLGIVRRVNGGGGTLLWDTRADPHHHMICRRCGRIEDMEVPLDLERARRSAARAGFEPDRAEVVVSGLCADCAAR
ncbi:MAG TPA: Fur family transcriptional regulator [Solirubrobacterales bacterium]|jgi:Fur family ferric uptake transcriptional regulator/Fur family peroxide stress response transcriptional regulator